MPFFYSTQKVGWRIRAAALTMCVAVVTDCKPQVEVLTTRRLNLELYNFTKNSQPQGQADTASKVEIDVDCGGKTWNITSNDDIFIPRRGKHSGKEAFDEDGAGGNVITIPTFSCKDATKGQHFSNVKLVSDKINKKYGYTNCEGVVTKVE